MRTSHATTSLIRTTGEDGKEMNLLVDPSLPGDILEARLYERVGIRAEAITHVFLTNWRPVHRRGLEKFSRAAWFMHADEIEAASDALERARQHADHEERQPDAIVDKELALLTRIQPAPDEFAEGVQLNPLIGYAPGQCGLILAQPTLTVAIAGDAVPTAGHFAAGQVFPDSWDLNRARESLLELYELADVIVPGHDNLFVAPRSAGM